MPASLPPPFLKKVWLKPEEVDRDAFPFARFPALLDDDFEMTFERPVTMFIGENGSGKSTILQALAEVAGFHAGGGTVGFQLHNTSNEGRSALARALQPSWLPKVSRGFFFRSDTYGEVARYIDDEGNPCMHKIPLWQQSHGESFLALFTERFTFQRPCIYFLDEPENALSPMRQMALLRFMRQWEDAGNAQIVLATHSPILMSYPGADLRWFDGRDIQPIAYADIEHVKVTRAFLANPDRYLEMLFEEAEDDGDG